MVKMLNKADIEWRGTVPIAPLFDDFYYATDNGLAESNFVFFEGIGAPDIWRGQDHYVIAETGFGTGLNFLLAYQKWVEGGSSGRLTFISAERYPLSEEAMEKAHSAFPSLDCFARQLRAAWPPPSPGFHPRFFENGKIQLLLLFGDATHAFSQLDGQIDAWFLDGFSPAKNPDMWSDDLFDQIARLSKPGARFATFTAAGFVGKALEARGFAVKKTDGFGRKRDRLVGQMQAGHQPPQPSCPKEWAVLKPASQGPVTIVGAGIAGRSLAAALRRRGRAATLLKSPTLPTASNVPASILAPGFQVGPQPTTDFVTSGFAQACWLPAYEKGWADTRGVELFASTAAEKTRFSRIKEALGWGPDWVTATENGLFYPQSGSLDTKAALDAVSDIVTIDAATVDQIEKTSAGWLLRGEGFAHETENLVLAAGAGTAHLLDGAANFGFTARAGQIERLKAGDIEVPARNLAASGYITAPTGGIQTLGSTFTDFDGDISLRPDATSAATTEILAKMEAEFGLSIAPQALSGAWTGVRAATIDYMPVIGPVPNWQAAASRFAPLAIDRKITGLGPMPYQDGLFILAGFGSKGYQQAPYAAEYLAAHLCGDPLPMARNVATYLHPARAFIRGLVRSGAGG